MSVSGIFLFLIKVDGGVRRENFHRSVLEVNFACISLISFRERFANIYSVNVGGIRFGAMKWPFSHTWALFEMNETRHTKMCFSCT